MRSIANLLSLSGGSHGNSSRNTSEYSHTTGTSKSVFSSTPSRLYTCGTSQDFKGSTSTFFPMGCSRVTSRGELEMTPLCLVNQLLVTEISRTRVGHESANGLRKLPKKEVACLPALAYGLCILVSFRIDREKPDQV